MMQKSQKSTHTGGLEGVFAAWMHTEGEHVQRALGMCRRVYLSLAEGLVTHIGSDIL